MKVSNKHSGVSNEKIEEMWNIGTEITSQVVETTTQLGVRKEVHPVERRFSTSQPHLRKKILQGR